MRYKEYGQSDDPTIIDGDEVFKGFATRYDADTLQPGMLSYAQNVRLDKGVIEPRKTSRSIQSYGEITGHITYDPAEVLDMISYNDGTSEQLLLSGNKNAHIHDSKVFGNLTEIKYPPSWLTSDNDNGFLLQTNVATMCFHNPSVSLPFSLDASAILGKQVARLEEKPQYSLINRGEYTESKKEFALWKQSRIFSIDAQEGEVRKLTLHEIPSFSVGEKVRVLKAVSTDLGVYKVSAINGTEVELKTCDNSERPNWATSSFLSSSAVVYSLEDQCPPGNFASWAGNRLIVPTGRHDIAVSSPLSTHDFPIYNKLTIGSQDGSKITALEPLVDDSLVVFKDNSVFIVNGIYSLRPADEGGSLAIIRISDQMGCVNNRCKKIIGKEVIFLSNQGLYALTLSGKGEGAIGLPPQAIRITDVPLSSDIQDLLLSESWGDFDTTQLFFNRGRLYVFSSTYLAIPYYQYLSVALVYNTLLSKWESIDYYEPGITKVCQLSDSGKSKIYAFNWEQGILELESLDGVEDVYNRGYGNFGVTNWVVTRGYRFNTFGNKLVRRVQISGENLDENPTEDSSRDLYISSDNPDKLAFLTEIKKDGTFNQRVQTKIHGESIKFEAYIYKSLVKIKRIVLEARDGLRQTFNRN
jgi:hypothetical protein